jgi:hypothetical protein
MERQRFGTPPPAGAGAGTHEPSGMEQRPAPGPRHPAATPPTGGPPGEGRAARALGGQPPDQPSGAARGGAPATGEHRAPGQPEGGKKKPERGTPPPGPQ